ncbi:hypothetical protein QYM36_005404 [Artemia franciscana]|uniref:Uncharacterized protein n=1 Tax=Artemia franciscana TaxID=6661 RepID=A0AA88IFE3_ARTSF|nr:hypothetical protein QYM36_005404 [Artemia franciscana]
MEKDGVTEKVKVPTEWVNSLVAAQKKDCTLRLCIDLVNFNKSIRRPFNPIPTLEDCTSYLYGANRVFEADLLCDLTSEEVILKLNSHFDRYDISQVMMFDNGSQSVAQEFKRFTRDWGFERSNRSSQSIAKKKHHCAVSKLPGNRRARLEGMFTLPSCLSINSSLAPDSGDGLVKDDMRDIKFDDAPDEEEDQQL